MMRPSDVRKYIVQMGADYGQDIPLPDDIDTSGSTKFFGTRCSDNVHVKDRRLAHVDRVDPRNNPIGHLKQDVGIPYTVMFASAGTALGTTFGALLSEDWKKGAKIGGVVGTLFGFILDISEKPISKKVENKIS